MGEVWLPAGGPNLATCLIPCQFEGCPSYQSDVELNVIDCFFFRKEPFAKPEPASHSVVGDLCLSPDALSELLCMSN